MRSSPLKFALLVSLLLALAAGIGNAESSRDQLRRLVERCLGPERASDCPALATDRDPADEASCKKTTQIWERNADFVVIRDLKECGCPSSFRHGLAMTLTYVSGVEAEDLPEGIWQFAWDAGRKRFADPSAVALAVNSRLQRSQDQLHVHIVELADGVRSRFPAGYSANLADLSRVWAEARALARERNLQDYGVLVTRAPGNGFTLLVTEGDRLHSPEGLYTRYRCH
jgi:CDP-diacylglycerol pyrophosphatase